MSVFGEGNACYIAVDCKIKKFLLWKQSKLYITERTQYLDKESMVMYVVIGMSVNEKDEIILDIMSFPINYVYDSTKRIIQKMSVYDFCKIMYPDKIKNISYDISKLFKYLIKYSSGNEIDDIILQGDYVVLTTKVKSNYDRQLGKVLTIVTSDNKFRLVIKYDKSILLIFDKDGIIQYCTDKNLIGTSFNIERKFIGDDTI